MILSSEYLGFALRLITVVVPVAVYFLILGLLNSRRHPQLLSGKQDFALLVVAISPLFILPAASLGLSAWAVVGMVGLVAAGIMALAPRGRVWVVYNIPRDQARDAIERCLGELGLGFTASRNDFELDRRAVLSVSEFPLLRNVTIRLRGGDDDLARRIERAMAAALSRTSAETSPTAVVLMLIATAMLIAPVTMFVQHVPQIVRLITDLMH
ncbi:MAG: hypothetical protein ACE15C_05645 [Phycisphaerae bacterium]